METRGKSAFFRPAFWGISSVFSLIYLVFFPKKYSTCDTCDSKKSTSLLEGARATRIHEKSNTEILRSRSINFCTSTK